MDNISVSSSSTLDQKVEYSKKVQMIMTSPDNPMICFEKLKPAPTSNQSLKQRGLVSQIAYLSTSAAPEKNISKQKKQFKTASSIDSLPGAFIVSKPEVETTKKLYLQNKNKTTLDSPEEKPKFSKAYKASKLDHTYDVLKNETYEDEPAVKKSINTNPNRLSHKFDIFNGPLVEEPTPKSAKPWKTNKLEHQYDIFKQYGPISS